MILILLLIIFPIFNALVGYYTAPSKECREHEFIGGLLAAFLFPGTSTLFYIYSLVTYRRPAVDIGCWCNYGGSL